MMRGKAYIGGLCGGAPARKHDENDIDGVRSVALQGRAGCGHEVARLFVPATDAPDAETRPLFKRTADAVICSHCDMPDRLRTTHDAELLSRS
ncbi:MAG TPA: hypothetical protein VFZ00_28360 [Solirubrobacter sp.]|nr:hypothetical protein [Solirubrobacter sp.]